MKPVNPQMAGGEPYHKAQLILHTQTFTLHTHVHSFFTLSWYMGLLLRTPPLFFPKYLQTTLYAQKEESCSQRTSGWQKTS